MNNWKRFWTWWLQKLISLLISVSIYSIVILTILVVHKIISDGVFGACFIAVIIQRAGKDIFDRLNNRKNNSNNQLGDTNEKNLAGD